MRWRSGRPKASRRSACGASRRARRYAHGPLPPRSRQAGSDQRHDGGGPRGHRPHSRVSPEMTWTERMRLAIDNYKEQIDARPLALPLSIAYSGMGPPRSGRRSRTSWPSCSMRALGGGRRSFSSDDLDPPRRLPAGSPAGRAHRRRMRLDSHQLDLMRRHFALAQLSLPRRVPEPRRERGGHGRGLADGPEPLVAEYGRPDHIRPGANARAQPRRFTAGGTLLVTTPSLVPLAIGEDLARRQASRRAHHAAAGCVPEPHW